MTINVDNAQVQFVDGKLAVQYFAVSFSAGDYPNHLNGNVQVTSDEGVTINSTPDEVIAIAKKKIQALIADVAA
ncbi:hypothetical protein [Leuconostoc citreum]|uniref:hypothetical protein n=1 Tax=Leuconostoc citreum TaxID=33964 RepID=UPI0021A663DE|nr:hypothetical protein [Leuconostoc citreum]MCT3071227.1 hypothetical protein [Leuconostoc citreum]